MKYQIVIKNHQKCTTSSMKKISLTLFFFALIANVTAQLKVNSSGLVGVGNANPQHQLDVIGNANVLGNIYFGSASNFLATNNSSFPITFKVNNTLAGFSGHSGNFNVSFGYGALVSNTSGNYNTATGYQALLYNTTGNYNTVNGAYALKYNEGDYNTAIGYNALYYATSGSYNTAIGSNTFISGCNNTTAIGYDASATSSNQVRIGNSSVNSIGGYANWSNVSDARVKKNMKADVPGLAFINTLQPVTYNLDLDAIDNLLKKNRNGYNSSDENELPLLLELVESNRKSREAKEKQVQTGFIAQNVEKTAKSIGYYFSGVDVDEKGIYALRYAEFVVPLVKAVQELSEQNECLQEQVNKLSGLVKVLTGKADDPVAFRSGGNSAFNGTTGMPDLLLSQCKLYQNAPNPFTENSLIRFYIPENIKTAQICIYDLQGKQIKQITVSQRREGSQNDFRIGIAGRYVFVYSDC